MNPKNNERNQLRIGDVCWMKFDGVDSEQQGVRPGVVFQNNLGNVHSPNIIALPLTTTVKPRRLPTHVPVTKECHGLKADSTILCENPQRMSKRRVFSKMARLDVETMKQVAVSSMLASGAVAYLTQTELVAAWQEAKRLNGIS